MPPLFAETPLSLREEAFFRCKKMVELGEDRGLLYPLTNYFQTYGGLGKLDIPPLPASLRFTQPCSQVSFENLLR